MYENSRTYEISERIYKIIIDLAKNLCIIERQVEAIELLIYLQGKISTGGDDNCQFNSLKLKFP